MKKEKNHSAHYGELEKDIIALKEHLSTLQDVDSDLEFFINNVLLTEMNDILHGIKNGHIILPFKRLRSSNVICYIEDDEKYIGLIKKVDKVQKDISLLNNFVTYKYRKVSASFILFVIINLFFVAFAIASIFIKKPYVYIIAIIVCVIYFVTLLFCLKLQKESITRYPVFYNLTCKGGKIVWTKYSDNKMMTAQLKSGYFIDLWYVAPSEEYEVVVTKNNDYRFVAEKTYIKQLYDVEEALQLLIDKYESETL